MNYRSRTPRKKRSSWWWRLPITILMMAAALAAFWFALNLYMGGLAALPASVSPKVDQKVEPLAPDQRCINGVRLEKIPGGWRDVPEHPC